MIGGTRVSKNDVRLEAYGTFDELSAFVAVLSDSDGVDPHQIEVMERIQNSLLILESCLALEQEDTNVSKYIPHLTDDDVLFLESEIDAINAQLEPLKSLIVPGGNILASRSHVCRTVCRRAERRLVEMGVEYEVDDILRRVSYIEFHSRMHYILLYSAKSKRNVIKVLGYIIIGIITVISIASGGSIAVQALKNYLAGIVLAKCRKVCIMVPMLVG